MVSGLARGRVRTITTTTTTESRNLAAIHQIIAWQRHATLVYRALLWYWTSLLWSIDTCQNKVSADHIMWPYRGLKTTAHRGHVFFWSWPLTKCWFWIRSRAHVRLICWKQGRNVRKPVTASPGLKFIRIITFFFYTNVFAALFCVFGDYETQNSKSNNKQKTSL